MCLLQLAVISPRCCARAHLQPLSSAPTMCVCVASSLVCGSVAACPTKCYCCYGCRRVVLSITPDLLCAIVCCCRTCVCVWAWLRVRAQVGGGGSGIFDHSPPPHAQQHKSSPWGFQACAQPLRVVVVLVLLLLSTCLSLQAPVQGVVCFAYH